MSENEIQELRRELGEVLGRLTRIETMLGERCASRDERIEKLESAVDALRISQAKVIGAAALLSVVIGYVLKGLGLE